MILYSLTKAVMRVFYGIFMPAKFVYGKENLNPNETVIYCANHRHAYDPLLLAVHVDRQIHFMAKKELFEKPVMRWALKNVGAFPVDRSRADVASIRTAVQYLKNGEPIGIFPEGTRHRESFGMGQIHDGAAWLALKSGAPIVPVFIDSRGMFHKIRFYVGEKLPLTLDEGEALNAKSRDAAAQKLAEAMARLEQMAENAQKR